MALLRTITGKLADAQVPGGAPVNSTDEVAADGAAALYFEYILDAGTSATIEIQQKLAGSITFLPVAGTSQASAFTTMVKVLDPAGTYKAVVTAQSTATITVNYHAAYR